MSTEDLVRAWKDPDQRGDTPPIDHPAGGIELAGSDAHGAAEEVPSAACTISIIATQALSCWPGSCEKTLFEGTCGAFSVGCC